MYCPNCGSDLGLFHDDASPRAVCPNCRTELAVTRDSHGRPVGVSPVRPQPLPTDSTAMPRSSVGPERGGPTRRGGGGPITWAVIAFAAVAGFLVCACLGLAAVAGRDPQVSAPLARTPTPGRGVPVADASPAPRTPAPGSTRTPVPPTPTRTATAVPLGSQQNPYPLRGADNIAVSRLDNGNRYEIRVLGVQRGEPARRALLARNMFNTVPAGREAVIVTVRVQYVESGARGNLATEVSYSDFKLFTAVGEMVSPLCCVVWDSELRSTTLFPGGVVEGDVIFSIPAGDPAPALVFKWGDYGRIPGTWYSLVD
ncbi:MAG: hypothetical protein KatS3mg060_0437 [Dehalococcoidia bacterium]|nr:MAG: hypothetical protein KatS3mg060_0437 [Dehalococcoidia bacterium]